MCYRAVLTSVFGTNRRGNRLAETTPCCPVGSPCGDCRRTGVADILGSESPSTKQHKHSYFKIPCSQSLSPPPTNEVDATAYADQLETLAEPVVPSGYYKLGKGLIRKNPLDDVVGSCVVCALNYSSSHLKGSES